MNAYEDLIFGLRPVTEAVNSGKDIDKVLIKKNLQSDTAKELLFLLRNHRISFQFVPGEKLNKITRKNHQGVIAFISPVTFHAVENIIPAVFEKGNTPLVLILDSITDVRNFGAITRTAECTGVDAIVIPSKGSARIGAETMKTSAGALNFIPVCKSDNILNTIKFLQQSGLQIIAATEKAEKNFFEIDFTPPAAIIMGSEEKGIHPKNLKTADELVRIPVLGKIQSLNVSVAAGILMYEAVKQRGK